MNLANEIKKLCIDEGISLSTLSDRTGQSRQNLSLKMRRNNFTINQLEELASALGYDVNIQFIKRPSSDNDN